MLEKNKIEASLLTKPLKADCNALSDFSWDLDSFTDFAKSPIPLKITKYNPFYFKWKNKNSKILNQFILLITIYTFSFTYIKCDMLKQLQRFWKANY